MMPDKLTYTQRRAFSRLYAASILFGCPELDVGMELDMDDDCRKEIQNQVQSIGAKLIKNDCSFDSAEDILKYVKEHY